MKKVIILVSILFCFIFSVPAFASSSWIPPGSNIQWPPPTSTYTVPSIGYDVNWLGIVADSFKISIRAVASKGFWLMMLFSLIGAIPDICQIFFIDPFEVRRGVRRRVLNRRVKAADDRRHHGEIIAEKVRDMELQNEAQQMYRIFHSDELLSQRVRQMEFNSQATETFKRENSSLISQRHLADMESNFFDRRQFKRDNRVELMMEKRYDMKESDSARTLHNMEDSDSIVISKTRNMETNAAAKTNYHNNHFNDEVEEKIYQRVNSHVADMEYCDRYSNLYEEKKDKYRQMANDYYDKRR